NLNLTSFPTRRSSDLFAAKLELTNDDFIRTTEPRHQQVVQDILARLHEQGHLYRDIYKGFYSTREETFLTDKDRLPDGTFDPARSEEHTSELQSPCNL